MSVLVSSRRVSAHSHLRSIKNKYTVTLYFPVMRVSLVCNNNMNQLISVQPQFTNLSKFMTLLLDKP